MTSKPKFTKTALRKWIRAEYDLAHRLLGEEKLTTSEYGQRTCVLWSLEEEFSMRDK